MARFRDRLKARQIKSLPAGKHADGNMLYLRVDERSRRWCFIFTFGGRTREMGLGGWPDVSLAEARAARDKAAALVRAGQDPIEARAAAGKGRRHKPTFGEVATDLIATKSPQWRNAKHRAQWATTLATYCGAIWAKPVGEVSTDDVLAILRPMWSGKRETASRLRGRIETVLDAARVQGHRAGENPARWRGHLALMLPQRVALPAGHHPAMPYKDVPAFMGRLRERPAITARALEFAILTAARSGEVLGATWGEIDLGGAVWTIPASRMKAGKEHRVPLVGRALAILRELAKARTGDFVFFGQAPRRPLSASSLTALLKRMAVTGVTVHGFRSSFADWAGEETSFPRELAEMALAHAVGNAVERSYRRGDALEKRRELLTAWAAWCGGEV